MAYTPNEWQCGDVISAEKMNNLEEGIQEALDCCSGGGSADVGYSCEETRDVAFEGSLTTTSYGSYSGTSFEPSKAIEGDFVIVTLNDTEYELPKVTLPFGVGYGNFENGDPVFVNYPCAVGIMYGQYYFFTLSGGTYQVTISNYVVSIETSDCFGKAVEKVMPLKNIKDGNVAGSIVQGALPWNAASGNYSHAEGSDTTASGNYSHAEGQSTTASGTNSHAEGFKTTASGHSAHAEGQETEASGQHSHAEGAGTIANHKSQHVWGEYNVADPSSAATTQRGTYVEIVGKGLGPGVRSNARTLDWNGNETIAGTLTQSSDKRLKEHIDYLGDDAVEFVRNLKPAHYTKDEADHVGFYAQDVAEVDKWNCMTGEMNGYMTLGYTELIAPLVAYCQHLEKRIAELEGEKA